MMRIWRRYRRYSLHRKLTRLRAKQARIMGEYEFVYRNKSGDELIARICDGVESSRMRTICGRIRETEFMLEQLREPPPRARVKR